MAADNFMWFVGAAKGAISSAAAQPKGESTDDKFSKLFAVELKKFDFSVENPTTIGSGTTGAGAGKAKFGAFKIEKDVDAASAPLYQACTVGAHFPTIMLAIRKAGGDKVVYLQYAFRMVFVTTISWSGGGGEENPTENVEFVYGAMGIQYAQQSALGVQMPVVEQDWSVVTNKNTLDVPPSLTGAPPWYKN